MSRREITRNVISLSELIEKIVKTYVKFESSDLFKIYNNQLLEHKKAITDAQTIRLVQQLELGCIDVVLEDLIMKESYEETNIILGKYEATSNLVSSEIENLVHSQSPSVGQKRKLAENNENQSQPMKPSANKQPRVTRKTAKKAKDQQANDSDKENRPPVTTVTQTFEKSVPLSDVTNRMVSNTSSVPGTSKSLNQTQPRNISLTNLQFEHMPRISFSCCLKMIQLTMCNTDSDKTSSKTMLLSVFDKRLQSLVILLSQEKFRDFVLKIVDIKLKQIKSEKLYDPEMFDKHQIYEFLSIAWINYFQRINSTIKAVKRAGQNVNTDADSLTDTVYQPNLTQRYGAPFFTKTLRYINQCTNIWSIINNQFQSLRTKIIIEERKYYAPCDRLTLNSYNQSGARKLCWSFLLDCVKTIKYHSNPPPSTALICHKVCISLLNLVFDISRSIMLKEEHFKCLSDWLFQMVRENSAKTEIGKKILNMIFWIHDFRNVSVVPIKYFALDFYNYAYFNGDVNVNVREKLFNNLYLQILKS